MERGCPIHKMSELVELDAQDLIAALKGQRNSALDSNAELYAVIEKQKREIAALLEKSKIDQPR